MPWNGSGSFTRQHDWTDDRDAGGNEAIIDADKMDEEFDNFGTGLENCVTRDGQNSPSADLPMNAQKHTGVGNADARNQYAAVGQVQDRSFNYVDTVGGTADAITLTPSPAITAYAAGQEFHFIAGGTNTTAVTVNVSGLGVKNITKNGTTALGAGDIVSGQLVRIMYDGTQFQKGTPASGGLTGPGSSTDGNIASFNGTGGDTLQDSGKAAADVVTGPASATDTRIATFNGTTGKIVQDGGKTIAELQDDVITTRGDIIRGSSGGTAERLAVGASGDLVYTDGTDTVYGKWVNALSAVSALDDSNDYLAIYDATTSDHRKITPADLVSQLNLARVATGTYTGDGATSQAITGVGFQPKFVRIWQRFTSDGDEARIVETTDTMVDDNASGMAVFIAESAGTAIITHEIDRIISLDSDGFTVDDGGADAFPNKNGIVYNYLAIG